MQDKQPPHPQRQERGELEGIMKPTTTVLGYATAASAAVDPNSDKDDNNDQQLTTGTTPTNKAPSRHGRKISWGGRRLKSHLMRQPLHRTKARTVRTTTMTNICRMWTEPMGHQFCHPYNDFHRSVAY
jgi:hypothetical protein